MTPHPIGSPEHRIVRPAIRLGLCCTFDGEPIRFRRLTATAVCKLPRAERPARIAEICRQNARSLREALQYCAAHRIGAFRINSQILPLSTHPELGYRLAELPGGEEIAAEYAGCGDYARRQGVRTSFHPDQFVVLNSPRPEVVAASIRELEYQAEVAEWVGADVINIHAGGAYGDKAAALALLERNLDRLSSNVRGRLTLENDDILYTPEDLLPLARRAGLPLVYDVHHHRCNRDGRGVEEATEAALATWRREPLFHLSSPLGGWKARQPRLHADYIHVRDFPACWIGQNLTVEVEAKAKERAVRRLQGWLNGLTVKARSSQG